MASGVGRSGYSRFGNDPEFGAGYGSNDYNSGAGPSSEVDHRARQAQLIAEQDEGLNNLANVISRQKELAVGIGREVESQNDLIDDIGVMTDHTNDRLRRQTTNVQTVERKSGTCTYWIIIGILACVIIAVIAIPF